jgi:hypothetical protein
MKRFSFAPLALLVLAGCGGEVITGTEFERRLAVIDFYDGSGVVVEVPTAATRGVGFDVAVTSYGNGCVEQADAEVEVSGLTATVDPHQLVAVGGVECLDVLRTFRHVAQLRFDQAGTAIVRFRGLRRSAGDTMTVERTVVVQ